MCGARADAGGHLRLERPADGVLLITLDRPEALNALTHQMHRDLVAVWDDVRRDDRTRVVVVTGAGRAFCAGNDLRQPPAAPAELPEIMDRIVGLVEAMTALDRPIVSAINGPAVGAGLALALSADISVAAQDARLIDAQVGMGVAAGEHACLLWPLLCGMARAKYHLLAGEPLLGADAARIGLVTEAVPREHVVDRAVEIATTLAAGGAEAIAATKRSVNGWLRRHASTFELSAALEMAGFLAADAQEARSAFAARRPPRFPSSDRAGSAGAGRP
jgi:enoyl-CoA hydratase